MAFARTGVPVKQQGTFEVVVGEDVRPKPMPKVAPAPKQPNEETKEK